MKPSFCPRLVNDPFSDPGLYIPFLYEKRAIMFDLGEITPLTPRDLLKITHVFVSHAHMDHFTGFDKLLRIFLGRDSELHLFGPPGFFSHVEGKLNGYVWNLVQEYKYNLALKVTEVHENRSISKRYLCCEGFRSGEVITGEIIDGILYKTPGFQVRGLLLDHRIPCLGFTLEEDFHVNINKEGLKRFNLDTGPWLNAFKKEIYAGSPKDGEFYVTKEGYGKIVDKRRFTLGDLTEKIATITPGQKITYITDAIGSNENITKIIALARGADHLFIEAAFSEQDNKAAKEKYHLTAAEAGRIARAAEVKKFTLFHFSPRYNHMESELINEAMEAYQGGL
jgi:ribonuclease Z